jgi:CRP-like cAMP-binding protein
VFGKCETRQLLEGDVLIEAGQSLAGLHIVGAGRLEVFGPEGDKRGELGAGDFVFASAVLGGGKAPARAVAGAGGALVLHASRHATHELLVSVPPLLEILTMM